MKVVVIKSEVKSEKLVDVAFDVGKGKLNCIFDAGNLRFSDELRNSTISIRGKLKSYMEQAWKHGMDGIRVLAEPSGGYEKALLKTAHRLGCRTAYVSG